MPRGPFHVESNGVCIYCGMTDVALSDEHVVPYSLGGSHILKKASCGRCADITKKFEQRVARDLWGNARIAFGAPSRRKRERKKTLLMPDPNGRNRDLTVRAADYPGGFVFYKMERAGLLQGLPADEDVSSRWQLVVIDDDKRRKSFLERYPARPLTLSFRHVPQEFGQLLAKIGYGHILTQLNPGEFRPICVPFILGHDANVSYVVGGTLEAQVSEANNGYSLGTAAFGSADRLMLVALVRLLANTHAPAYHIVVGDVLGADRVEHVMQKLGSIVAGADSMETTGPGCLEHWQPEVWPLPFWIEGMS